MTAVPTDALASRAFVVSHNAKRFERFGGQAIATHFVGIRIATSAQNFCPQVQQFVIGHVLTDH
jgi:hypothetical protein